MRCGIRSRMILCLFFVCMSTDLSAASNGSWVLHQQAWNSLVDSKAVIAKYAFYADRLLSVRHPEIYLQADIKILKDIENQNSSIASKIKWENLKDISTIADAVRYPVGAPFFGFLDRRILPPTATLAGLTGEKSVAQIKMTSIEKAVIGYYQLKKGSPGNDLAILYCSDNGAYLVDRGFAISMKDMLRYDVEKISCVPVLLFDESDSWFWVLGKNSDAEKFRNIIKKLPPAAMAEKMLTPKESLMIGKFSRETELNTEREKNIALLFAQKRGPIIALNKKMEIDRPLLGQWLSLFNYSEPQEINIDRVHTGVSHLLMQEVNILGGRLSPMAAYVADISECKGDAALCIASRYKPFFEWKLVWPWGFTSFSIDESLISGGGGVCAEQSSNMAAILDLLKIDYYALHLTGINSSSKKKDHRIIFVPSWNVTFSNSKVFKGFVEPNGYKGLVYIYNKGKWLFFADKIMMGNSQLENAKTLFSNFLNMASTNNLTNQLACRPFANEANFSTCNEMGNKLDNGSYSSINVH